MSLFLCLEYNNYMKKLIALILISFSIKASSQSQSDRIFIGLINGFRAENGLGALKYDATLDSAAEWHSAYMAKTGVLSHTESLYPTPQSRIEKYDPKAFAGKFDRYEVLENANRGAHYGKAITDSLIVVQAFEAWKGSPPHRAAMLNAKAQFVAFGDSFTSEIRKPFPDTFFTVWTSMLVATKPFSRMVND